MQELTTSELLDLEELSHQLEYKPKVQVLKGEDKGVCRFVQETVNYIDQELSPTVTEDILKQLHDETMTQYKYYIQENMLLHYKH